MGRSKNPFIKNQNATNFVLIEGEIVELSRKAVKLRQRICRCLSAPGSDCICQPSEVWIPKSLIRHSPHYNPNSTVQAAGFLLWQTGAAKFQIPAWKAREIFSENELPLR